MPSNGTFDTGWIEWAQSKPGGSSDRADPIERSADRMNVVQSECLQVPHQTN